MKHTLRLIALIGLLAIAVMLALDPPRQWPGSPGWTLAMIVAITVIERIVNR